MAVFSSNYALYGDLSARVMKTLARFTPSLEVYSIDEAFLDLTGLPQEASSYGRHIRETVARWIGLPVSIGIGPHQDPGQGRQPRGQEGLGPGRCT